jgi:hypothetical protein
VDRTDVRLGNEVIDLCDGILISQQAAFVIGNIPHIDRRLARWKASASNRHGPTRRIGGGTANAAATAPGPAPNSALAGRER